MSGHDKINIKKIAVICKRYGVSRIEVFGSFARGEATPESDMDLLLTFKDNARPGIKIVQLKDELERLFNRKVDLLTRTAVENSPNKYRRRFILADAKPLFPSEPDTVVQKHKSPYIRDLVRCEDIRLHAKRIRSRTSELSYEEFIQDETLSAAVVRWIEIIGEAARRISIETRSLAPSIPWREMIGIRNILIHEYSDVDLKIVYQVATQDIPSLANEIDSLIVILEEKTHWQDNSPSPSS